ncbi:MAG: DegV family protein [Peptoniphilaceae bacterium]
MNIKIVTDSGVDLPIEILKKYDIEVLPIVLNDGEREYSGSKDLSSEIMFKNMRNKVVYGTSQVNNIDYINCFEKYAKENIEILYISLSSGITGTYERACIVKNEILKKYKSAKIHIFDSKCAATGFGMLVSRAAMMASDGKDINYIINALEFFRDHMHYIFSVTTFEFLLRGGRVSKSQAIIGGLLNIKPILELNNRKDGKISNINKVRGEKVLYKKLSQYLEERSVGEFNKNQTICITYGDNIKNAEKLKEIIIDEYSINEDNISIIQMGTVIGAHTGPDIIALFFVDKLFDDYNIIK